MSKFSITETRSVVQAEAFEIVENVAPNRSGGGRPGGRNAERRREQEEKRAREEEAQAWNRQYNRNPDAENAYPGSVLGLPPPITNSAQDMQEYLQAYDALRVKEIEREFKRVNKRLPIGGGKRILEHRQEKGDVDAYGILQGENVGDTLPPSEYPPLTAKEIERAKQVRAKVNKGGAVPKNRDPKINGKDRKSLAPQALLNKTPAPAPGFHKVVENSNVNRTAAAGSRQSSAPAKKKKMPAWMKELGYSSIPQDSDFLVDGKPRQSLAPQALNKNPAPAPEFHREVENSNVNRTAAAGSRQSSAPAKKKKMPAWMKELGYSSIPQDSDFLVDGKPRQSLAPQAYKPRNTNAANTRGPAPGTSRPTGARPKTPTPPTKQPRPPSPTTSGPQQPSATTRGFYQPSATRGLPQPSARTSGLPQPSATTRGIPQPSARTSRLQQPSASRSGIQPPSQTFRAPQAKSPQRQRSPQREAVNAQEASGEAQGAYEPGEIQETEKNYIPDARRIVKNPAMAADNNKRMQQQGASRFGFRGPQRKPQAAVVSEEYQGLPQKPQTAVVSDGYQGLPQKPQSGGGGEPTVQDLADAQMQALNEHSPPGGRRTSPNAARDSDGAPEETEILVMNRDGSPSPRRIRVPADVAQVDGAIIVVDPHTDTAVLASPSMIYFSPERKATSPAYSVPSPSRTPPIPPPELLQIRLLPPSPQREEFDRLGADFDDGLDAVNIEDDLGLVSPESSISSRGSPGERLRREAERAVTRVNRAEKRRLQKSPEHLSFDRLAEDFDGGVDGEVLEDPDEINLVSPPSPSRSRRSPRRPEEVNLVTPTSSRPQTQPRSKSPRRSPRRPTSQPGAMSPGERLRQEAIEMVARVNAAERNRLAAVDKAEDKVVRRLRDRLNAIREGAVDVAEVKRQVNESLDARYEEAERRRKAARVVAPPPKTPPKPKPRWRKEEMEGAAAPEGPTFAAAELAIKNMVDNIKEISLNVMAVAKDAVAGMQLP